MIRRAFFTWLRRRRIRMLERQLQRARRRREELRNQARRMWEIPYDMAKDLQSAAYRQDRLEKQLARELGN